MLDRIANVVPYVAFLVALFFVELQLFGVEDALLGVIFQSFARTMVESAGLSFINYLKHAALFLVMSLCSSLAGLHPVLLVAGSAVYMFCITLMNSDDYLPRNFFMLGLGFLLLEIYPISAHEIPMRMGNVVCCCLHHRVYLCHAPFLGAKRDNSRSRLCDEGIR